MAKPPKTQTPAGNTPETLAVRPRSGYTTPNVTDHTELQK
ncbi:hypothetical protein EDC59_11284 [Pseudodesulfovibrio indicus]|jgi:hypothetical protein|uniref:Uncharacterized protein n=1 Tax=Pseudodesulfovibrio indicus TaxID=1716143 RepID=A0AA94PU22_9BACT|nr:hypothetical protein EDC59_11284 [Pseudodesulfovibrio indicus]